MLKKLNFLFVILLLSSFALGACYDGDVHNSPTSQEDIFTKSFVADGDVRKIDACMDSDNLWEYDCSIDGGRKVLCEYGCEDGACRLKPQNQFHIAQTGRVIQDPQGNPVMSMEMVLLLILLGAVIAMIFSLRKIYGLEQKLVKMDIKLEKLLRKKLKGK